jgi:glucose-1-phosphate cytidylyltransferase
VILLGYKGYVIKEYFANYLLHTSSVTINTVDSSMEVIDHRTDNWKVTLLETGLNTMTGGRIKQAEKLINGEEFLLTYGDGVSDVNISATVDFHRNHGGLLTMTSVQPQSRYGNLSFEDHASATKVKSFQEKPKGERGWINGGFFVCSPGVFDYIPDDMTVSFEGAPLENISADGKLFAYKHDSFWLAMDSLRDKNDLEKLWNSNNAKWKVWKD